MGFKEARAFLVTSEVHNLTRAAEVINVSQDTVFRQIFSLEQDLEVTLIEHGNRPFVLPLRMRNTLAIVA